MANSDEDTSKLVTNMEETIDLSGSIEVPIKKITHSSLGQRIKALDFPGGYQLKQWLNVTREGVRPWTDFANASKFNKPLTMAEGSKRLFLNVNHFRSNYFYVVFGIAVFCLLGACYAVKMKNSDKKVIVMGKELSLTQQYMGVGIVSLPILWLAGAGNAFFWIIGASIVVIVLHALFHQPPADDQDEMFGVVVG